MAIDVRFGSPALPGTFTVTTPTPERPARKLLLPILPHTRNTCPQQAHLRWHPAIGTLAGIGTASPRAYSHRTPGFVSTPMSSLTLSGLEDDRVVTISPDWSPDCHPTFQTSVMRRV